MDIETYQKTIKAIDPKSASEASYRTALEVFLNGIKFAARDIKAIQEPKDSEVDGIPDFHVYDNANGLLKELIGFVECKNISADLEKVIKSEQIKKYAKTTDNIIITDYKRFILLQNYQGNIQKRDEITLLDDNLNLSKEIKSLTVDFEKFFFDFISYEYPYINTKKRLVEELAKQSFYFSVKIREELQSGNTVFAKSFGGLFKEYSATLHYHYSKEDFCDIFAQSFVYALLIARLEDSDLKYNEVDKSYTKYVPENYRILSEFLNNIQDIHMPRNLKIASWQVAKYLNLIHIEAIQAEFEKGDDGRNSVIVYLYEDFLKEFDKLRETENRKENGVYYTPKEVVDFIVRNVNFLIKNKLNKRLGFSEKNVKILDFATGTGSFMESVINEMAVDAGDDLSKAKFKKKILEDIYGFELQFTPYIVAHIVLSKALKSYDIKLKKDEALGVFIANTLDLEPISETRLFYLSEENEKVSKIKKEENILAIIGNPPYYNGKNPNKSEKMSKLLQDYKKGLNEKKINLDDLYIQFIRFAEHKVSQHDEGVIGIITNNSFLSGINHRQMRKHLFETFDEIYVLNLHGSTRSGDVDKNVFDIMVGVNITFFVKKKKKDENKKIHYYSILDAGAFKRAEKLSFLENNDIIDINWTELKSRDDNLFFVERDYDPKYKKFIKLTDIFSLHKSGLSSSKDNVAISYTKERQESIVKDFANLSESKIRKKYGKIVKGEFKQLEDRGDWELSRAILDAKQNNIPENYRIVHYRPFDIRWCFNSLQNRGFFSRPGRKLTTQMMKDNYALIFPRGVANNFSHGFISKYVPEYSTGGASSSKETNVAPLYVYKERCENGNGDMDLGEAPVPNFTAGFQSFLENLNFSPNPEDILAYIYCILHSPIYRYKYADSLKGDFPAIPITAAKNIFYKYAKLGEKLIHLHVMKHDLQDKAIKVKFKSIQDFVVDIINQPKGSNDTLIIHGKDDSVISFHGITEDIYKYDIGGHQPIHRWLNYRKRDKIPLNLDDIEHVKNMIIIIKRTIEIMKEIEALGEAYLEDI